MAKPQPLPGEQGELPGYERPKIEEIERAANLRDDLKEQRAALAEKITAADYNLNRLLFEHRDELGVRELEHGQIEIKYAYARGGDLRTCSYATKGKIKTRGFKEEDAEQTGVRQRDVTPIAKGKGKKK